MTNELDTLITDAQAPQSDPIVAEQNVRILDHLMIVRGLMQERADGMNARAAAAKAAEEARIAEEIRVAAEAKAAEAKNSPYSDPATIADNESRN